MATCFVVLTDTDPAERELAGLFSSLELAKAAVEQHLAGTPRKHAWFLEHGDWLYLDEDSYSTYRVSERRIDHVELFQDHVDAPVRESDTSLADRGSLRSQRPAPNCT